MNSIAERLNAVRATLPSQGVRLVAVSKYHPVDQLLEAYEAGQRLFGENHAQELAAKAVNMPDDVEWHFIGHLQTNKVRLIAPYVSMIESVDSLRLLLEIDKRASQLGRSINCLLQIHIAQEQTKFGLTPDELYDLLGEGRWKECSNVNLCGLMTMATNTENVEQVRREFRLAADIFRRVKADFFSEQPHFCELSMGMSHDYPIAIEEQASIVRVGTMIFGKRNYTH